MLRPSLLLRIYTIAFGIVWCGFLAFAFVAVVKNRDYLPAIFIVGLFAFGAFFSSSQACMRVVADGDELRVRNYVTENRFHRSEIDRFIECSLSGMPSAFGGEIAMLLTDDRLIGLRATQSGPLRNSRRAKILQRLRGWHTHIDAGTEHAIATE